MKNALNGLPCFTQVERIIKITSGLSQHCFKVIADNKVYFAKTISDNTEVSVTECASKFGLSPNVIYHDQHWLITNFIEADNLAQSTINTDDKIKYAIKQMVQCHQLTIKPVEFSAKDIIKSLLSNSHYPKSQKTALSQLAELLLVPLNVCGNGVCCHGDLNFSNVIINKDQNTWLVDFECACTAPIEYDLAMFIAVNNLARNEITVIVKEYEIQSSLNVDPQLLNDYLLFCYFINALWYFNAYHEKMQSENRMPEGTESTEITESTESTESENNEALLKHAQRQWHALQSYLKTDDLPLLSRLSIKLTDILTTFDFSN